MYTVHHSTIFESCIYAHGIIKRVLDDVLAMSIHVTRPNET